MIFFWPLSCSHLYVVLRHVLYVGLEVCILLTRIFFISLFSLVISCFFLSTFSFSAEVQSCRKIKRSPHLQESVKVQPPGKSIYCSIRPRVGKVGDYVEIKNRYNYIVAVGRIVKLKSVASIVRLTKYQDKLGSMSGYPVFIRADENQDYWNATTAPF